MKKNQNLPATILMLGAKASVLFFERLIPLVLHGRSHMALLKTLSSHSIAALRGLHPKMKYKYLRKNYLFTSLSTTDALGILKHHYRTLSEKISPDFFPRLFNEQPVLWRHQTGECGFGIRVGFPRDLNHLDRMHDHEGDLSLLFEANGVPIYILCLTLIPRHIAKRNFCLDQAGHVLFIGRVQGVSGRFSEVRAATKALHDITPARLLLSAAEAIAAIFDAGFIVGVPNDLQLSKYKMGHELEQFFDYDTFWTSLGADKTASGFFIMPANLPDKPIESIQQKHRSRTLAKRRFRKVVVDTTGLGFHRQFLGGGR